MRILLFVAVFISVFSHATCFSFDGVVVCVEDFSTLESKTFDVPYDSEHIYIGSLKPNQKAVVTISHYSRESESEGFAFLCLKSATGETCIKENNSHEFYIEYENYEKGVYHMGILFVMGSAVGSWDFGSFTIGGEEETYVEEGYTGNSDKMYSGRYNLPLIVFFSMLIALDLFMFLDHMRKLLGDSDIFGSFSKSGVFLYSGMGFWTCILSTYLLLTSTWLFLDIFTTVYLLVPLVAAGLLFLFLHKTHIRT